MMVIAVGAGERHRARSLPELAGMLRRAADDAGAGARVQAGRASCWRARTSCPATDEHGLALWQKLMVHTSEAAAHEGRPLHLELVRAPARRRTRPAPPAVRGIWGFHGDHPPHGDKLLQVRRHVPVITTVIDTPERISAGVRDRR